MIRTLPLLLMLLAPALHAEEVVEYNDTIYLFDHETVRYRIRVESYGANENLHVDVYVRGLSAPPRARVLEDDFHEVKRREDTNGDWIIDFDFTAKSPFDPYYIEVDSEYPHADSWFEVRIVISGEDAESADVDIDYVKVFLDYEDGGPSDHYNCAARTGAGLPLAPFAALAAVIWRLRGTRQTTRKTAKAVSRQAAK